MDGGQKVNIPLDSELDIKSSDMLVPVNKPKFQHNRQKFQGRYLPSSVRFEHDGYAAGNDVYEFDVSEAQHIDTENELVIIRKVLDESNPTYEFRIRNSSGSIIGTLIYTASSYIKDHNTESCELNDTHITGVFNNKPFDLIYNRDSIHEPPVEADQLTHNSDIIITDYDILSKYASRIKIYDADARIELNFAGMLLPSEDIQNGEYLFGKFLEYIEGTSTWQCGSYTFNVIASDESYIINIKDSKGAVVPFRGAPVVVPDVDSNSIAVSFGIDLPVDVHLDVDWQRIYPYFKNTTITSPGNKKTVAYDADDTKEYNLWSFSMLNEPAAGTYVPQQNEHIWYRNFKNGHTDTNSKIVKHSFPLWIGMSGIVTKSMHLASWDVEEYHMAINLYATDSIRLHFRTNSVNDKHKVLKYATYSSRYNRDIRDAYPVSRGTTAYTMYDMWIGTHRRGGLNVIQDRLDRLDAIPITNIADRWNSPDFFDDDISGIKQSRVIGISLQLASLSDDSLIAPGNILQLITADNDTAPGMWLYFPFMNDVADIESLREALTLECTSTPDFYVKSLEIHIPMCYLMLSKDLGIFVDDGQTYTVNDYMLFINVELKKQAMTRIEGNTYRINPIKSTKTSYKYATTNGNTTTYYDVVLPLPSVKGEITRVTDTATGQIAALTKCTLASKVSMCKDAFFTETVDASFFKIEPADDKYYDNSEVNVSSMFKHIIGTVDCTDKLSIGINLCSKDTVQYIYYTKKPIDSNEETDITGQIPLHIKYNSLDDTQYPAEPSPWNRIAIRPAYSLTNTRDADFNCALLMIGEPVMYNKDTFYRCIRNVNDRVDQLDRLPGNIFTEKLLPEFINDSLFEVTEPAWWIDISKVYDSDMEYIRGNLDAKTQQVRLKIGTSSMYRFAYDILRDRIVPDLLDETSESGDSILPSSFAYKGMTIYNNSLAYNKDKNDFVVTYKAPVEYTFSAAVPVLADQNMYLVSYRDNIAIVNIVYNSSGRIDGDRYIQLSINFSMRQVTLRESGDAGITYSNERECDERWTDATTVDIIYDGSAYITCCLRGIYSSKDISDKHVGAYGIEITCNGINTLIPFDMNTSGIACKYTNINDAQLHNAIQFAELKTDAELQFLKQAWDSTSKVENFWWIDKEHILELDKDKFILRHKTGELDDWNGDSFTDNAHSVVWQKTELIDSSVQHYFCTSAYSSSTARLITIAYSTGNVAINIYDPLLGDAMLEPHNVLHKNIVLTKKAISARGVLLNETVGINTYSDIQPDILITQSKWSATCIDNRVIVGIHYDNNFNQWAVVINLNTGNVEKVIQGYGFVGVHGELTGGEIPTKWFDPEIGFIGAVRDIEYLKTRFSGDIKVLSDVTDVVSAVVGNDSQQWYIDNVIDSIVSHLEYVDNGNFRVVELPVSSNYSAGYKSASFGSSVVSDMFIKGEAVKDILPIDNGAWTTALVLWLYPIIYSISPKITTLNYLQQALGQAAYVHYNSTSLTKQSSLLKNEHEDAYKGEYDIVDKNISESPELLAHTNSDELSFDKQKVKQVQTIKDPYSSALLLCAAALSSVASFATDNIKIDDKNTLHVDSTGKHISQYFEENIGSDFFTQMSTQSVASTQTSEVIALKTLDMFYSTSEKQNVRAGRGYVNHNFVAQCVVQSVESIQSQLLQQRITFVIKELSMLALNIEYKLFDNLRTAALSQVQASAGIPWVIVGLANGATAPLSPFAAIGYAAAEVALNYVEVGKHLMSDLMDSMGGGRLQAAVTTRQSHKDHPIEHKHRYGTRTECFMYPCFGISTPQTIKSESVKVSMQKKTWKLAVDVAEFPYPVQNVKTYPNFVTDKVPDYVRDFFQGDIPYFTAMVKGVHKEVQLPDRMAYVIGAETFLPADDYKNRSVGESEPVFPTPPFQDYIIDDRWQLAQTASDGMTTWISCRDTKIIDGDYSNIVVSDDFCGVACPYAAIEVKRGIDKKYIRPWAITPNAIALNNTGMNCVYDEKIYHAFDGYGYRVVNWMGAPGMGKNHQTLMYSFLVNDRFKRGNKMPPNEFIGNFSGEPTVDIHGDSNDKVFTLATQPGEGAGLVTGTVGEDKDVRRYAIPVFSEFVNTMPAAVKTIAVQTLSVIDGITSLTTENRDLQTAYKAPVSIDFTIGKNKYRYTQEYICQVTQERGVTLVQDLVPCLGLTYLGSTPYEAYLYSQAERQYYVFTGNSALRKVDMIERFRNVINGRYDFVNQEVILPCVATFLRLDNKVKDDDDETDNTMVARLSDNKFLGEVQPPLDTIYNTRSGFRTVSVPSGIAFQGPNRCIINRFVVSDYMIDQIKANYGKWSRVPREEYHPFRTYKAKYERVDETIGDKVQVEGWTHNPFLLVTAPLGVSENVDCLFEWEITFCYPVEMEKLYGPDNYAVVNVQAETMTPGGKVVAERPVHIYLTKELFTRSDKYGYYSFRYQSRCGAGNRERLHIWSDQYICVSSLDLEYKPVTQRRTEILTQQVDVQRLTEI